MVTEYKTDIFEEDKFKYYLEYSNDPTVLNIDKLIEFYDDVYSEGENNVIDNIRNYALETVDMSSCMKPIIDYIKE